MNHDYFMHLAFQEAVEGMKSRAGGPFGAVVVLKGRVIGRSSNKVLLTNDPTAHAEVMAIRDACSNAGHFHIPDAILYTTCEPCPMCFGAIYWAGIKEVYYASTGSDAEKMGFSDKLIYDEISLPPSARKIQFVRHKVPEAETLIEKWISMPDKNIY